MKKTVFLAILTVITILCIIGGTIYHVSGFIDNIHLFDFSGVTLDHSRVTYSEDLDEFSAIDLDTSVMDITLETGDTFHLSYDCVSYLVPEVTVKKGTLFLTQPDVPHFGGSNNACSMTLTVPSGTVFTNADISSDVGNIRISGLQAEDADIQADVGDLTISGCTFTRSELDADVGDIDIGDTDFGKSEITADVGDVEITGALFTNLEISNDIGDISVDVDADLSDYQMDLSTDLGSVTLNGVGYKRSFSQKGTKDSKGLRLTIENSTGDIDVTYPSAF